MLLLNTLACLMSSLTFSFLCYLELKHKRANKWEVGATIIGAAVFAAGAILNIIFQ